VLKRKIPDAFVRIVQEELAALAKRLDAPIEACVSTRDGMTVADHPPNRIGLRLPVMAGTIHALGNSIAAECSLSACQNVMLEGTNSHMILLSVPCFQESLVLMTLADRQTSLGMLLCFARECSQAICARWERTEEIQQVASVEETPLARILRGLSSKASRARTAE
jgi:predicted regulator of Ras-like GTPase activity (Roadblock/LC7/MglB family)